VSTALSPAEVLARVPQREPFRFVDEILHLDDEVVEAAYTWRPDADFYRGHFPGHPVTPGVLLIECMAQAALVPLAIHLLAKQGRGGDAEKTLTLFTDAQVDFSGAFKPGDRVLVRGRKLFFRRGKLRCEVEMRLEDGSVVCSGVLSGMGVAR
jgi:3-hydroxyacyl-[acyl-carrier-protein] dehydratase